MPEPHRSDQLRQEACREVMVDSKLTHQLSRQCSQLVDTVDSNRRLLVDMVDNNRLLPEVTVPSAWPDMADNKPRTQLLVVMAVSNHRLSPNNQPADMADSKPKIQQPEDMVDSSHKHSHNSQPVVMEVSRHKTQPPEDTVSNNKLQLPAVTVVSNNRLQRLVDMAAVSLHQQSVQCSQPVTVDTAVPWAAAMEATVVPAVLLAATATTDI